MQAVRQVDCGGPKAMELQATDKKNICPVSVEKAKLKHLELKERSLYGSYNLI